MSTAVDFTDAERAEWQALMNRAADLAEQHKEALREAGGWLVHRIENPDSADFALTQAEAAAERARALWVERAEVAAEADALPFGAYMTADLDDRLAAWREARRVAQQEASA